VAERIISGTDVGLTDKQATLLRLVLAAARHRPPTRHQPRQRLAVSLPAPEKTRQRLCRSRRLTRLPTK
jgi:hypothetical protein